MKNYAYNESQCNVALIAQNLATGVATDGSVVLRRGFDSGILHINVGAVDAGTLTSVVAQLQHGAESDGSDMADCTTTQMATSSLTVSAVNTDGKLALDLRNCKEYIRIVITATLAGGGATVFTGASFILGEAAVLPVSQA